MNVLLRIGVPKNTAQCDKPAKRKEAARGTGTQILIVLNIMIFRQSLLPAFSFAQARNASFLPRAGKLCHHFIYHKNNILVVASISNLLEKPKGVGNAYTLYYAEQFPVFKKQCIIIISYGC
jgi:hypothetical protein